MDNRQNISWNKTIVCDVDDTISIHTNRDYENAKPIFPVIEKLNSLYRQGYKIIYFTARGQLSLNGDIEKIEAERGPVLRAWLKKYNVLYDELKFTKPIANWYIDDKALRPDEFLNLEIYNCVGGSGAEVRREGDRIIKTFDGAEDQVTWYKHSSNYSTFKTPKIHNITMNTINMEFVDGYLLSDISLNFKNEREQLKRLIKIVKEFSLNKSYLNTGYNDYHNKIARRLIEYKKNNIVDEFIVNKLEKTFLEFESSKIIDKLYCKKYNSHMHGDLTYGNVIKKGDDLFLIDPNCVKNSWSSYLLDYARLAQSIHYNYEFEFGFSNTIRCPGIWEEYKEFLIKENIYDLILFLEYTGYIGMLKYKNISDQKKVINILNKLEIELYDVIR